MTDRRGIGDASHTIHDPDHDGERWLQKASQIAPGFPATPPPPRPRSEDAVEFGEGTPYHQTLPAGPFPASLHLVFSLQEARRLFTELQQCPCCARHQQNKPEIL